MIMESLPEKADRLLRRIGEFPHCAVAFSGGVDSAVVAKAAHLALGDRAVAVTAVSASLPQGELESAVEIAKQIGIRHQILPTHELDSVEYVRNSPDRCYHCKTELYRRLEELTGQAGIEILLNGANLDDTGDYRPGMRAAQEHRVYSPLLECGFRKQDVRDLAAYWRLSIWDKPASPCLSSRVAYGEEVTPERLAMIDQAEQFLRQHGFRLVRVRFHRGDLARIEVPSEELPRLVEQPFRSQFTQRLQELGFKFVTLDLAGFRSGSLNALLPGTIPLVQLSGDKSPPA